MQDNDKAERREDEETVSYSNHTGFFLVTACTCHPLQIQLVCLPDVNHE